MMRMECHIFQIYLAARMYADLTDFNAGYEELLSNILGRR